MNKNKNSTMKKEITRWGGCKSTIEAINSNQMCFFTKGLNERQRLKLMNLSRFKYMQTHRHEILKSKFLFKKQIIKLKFKGKLLWKLKHLKTFKNGQVTM